MKANKQNIILDSINYLKIFLPLHKEFNTFKHIGQAISDPLKVSYISQGKINGIKENTGVKIGNRPTDEQRNKYFTATSIEKLLKKLFVINTSEESATMYDVVNKIDDYLRQNIEYKYFITDDVSGFYHNEPENYNGSCMAGKPKRYFELYDHINKIDNDVTVKIVGFKTQDLTIARGLLWCKTYKLNQEGKTNKVYFLDRIYVHSKLQNASFSKLQFELFQTIRKHYRLDKLDVFNKGQIESYLVSKYGDMPKFSYKTDKKYCSFCVDVSGYEDLDSYPYMDTLKYIDDSDLLNVEQEDAIIILDQTNGEYTSNECTCDECGYTFDEDDLEYSEIDNQDLCSDCREYIDERDEYVNSMNALYNEYTGYFHYSGDIR